MTIGFIVDQDIDVSNPQSLTLEQLEKCIDKDNKSFIVFNTLEDAIRVAKEEPRPSLAFPIFEVTYEGKGRQADYELSNGESIAARRLLARQITLQSVSLAHAVKDFQPIEFEAESDDEEIDQEEEMVQTPTITPVVTQTPSKMQRLLTGTGNVLSTIASYLPRPSILVGAGVGAGTYYFEGAKQVAPSLLDSLRQSMPASVPPVAVDVAVAVGTGLVASGLTEGAQRVAPKSLHFGYKPKQNNATVNSSVSATNDVEQKKHAKLK